MMQQEQIRDEEEYILPVIIVPEPCTEGLSCVDFMKIAGSDIPEKNLPAEVVKMMKQHREACGYHNSDDFLHTAGLSGKYARFSDKARA